MHREPEKFWIYPIKLLLCSDYIQIYLNYLSSHIKTRKLHYWGLLSVVLVAGEGLLANPIT